VTETDVERGPVFPQGRVSQVHTAPSSRYHIAEHFEVEGKGEGDTLRAKNGEYLARGKSRSPTEPKASSNSSQDLDSRNEKSERYSKESKNTDLSQLLEIEVEPLEKRI